MQFDCDILFFFRFQKKTKFRENKCINKDVIKTAKPNKNNVITRDNTSAQEINNNS